MSWQSAAAQAPIRGAPRCENGAVVQPTQRYPMILGSTWAGGGDGVLSNVAELPKKGRPFVPWPLAVRAAV